MADHSLLRGILCNTSNLEKTPVTIINEVASTMRSQPDFRFEESFQSHSLQKSYCCTVRLCNGQLIGRGIGSNKRDAKQRASQHALEQLTTMINLTRHQVFLPVCRHSFQFCLAASFPVADTPLLFQFTTLPLPQSPSILIQLTLPAFKSHFLYVCRHSLDLYCLPASFPVASSLVSIDYTAPLPHLSFSSYPLCLSYTFLYADTLPFHACLPLS